MSSRFGFGCAVFTGAPVSSLDLGRAGVGVFLPGVDVVVLLLGFWGLAEGLDNFGWDEL